MTLDDRQFENVARYMDGAEELALSADQRQMLDEVRKGERVASALMDVPVGSDAMWKAHQAVAAALKHQKAVRSWRRVGYVGSSVAAAAAAVLIALTLNGPGTTPTPMGEQPVSHSFAAAATETPIAPYRSPAEVKIDALAQQMDRVAAEIHKATHPASLDERIRFLDSHTDAIITDDPLLGFPAFTGTDCDVR